LDCEKRKRKTEKEQTEELEQVGSPKSQDGESEKASPEGSERDREIETQEQIDDAIAASDTADNEVEDWIKEHYAELVKPRGVRAREIPTNKHNNFRTRLEHFCVCRRRTKGDLYVLKEEFVARMKPEGYIDEEAVNEVLDVQDNGKVVVWVMEHYRELVVYPGILCATAPTTNNFRKILNTYCNTHGHRIWIGFFHSVLCSLMTSLFFPPFNFFRR
jgi:hypothetical protein